MSKESRRRQRMAGQQTGERPGGDDRPASSPATRSASGPAATRPSTAQRSTQRAGRRERARPTPRGSFIQRYRSWLVAAAVVAVVAIVGAGVFAAATQPAFACSTEWVPDPTSSPAGDASPQPGFVQPDMGNTHVATGTVIRYTYCPPASGRHFNQPGVTGPIAARPYGPNDGVIPQNWVHNLEHGALVILYRGAESDQAALRALYDAVPASPVCGFEPGGSAPGPLIARFDQMAWPYAAIVWDRVLPLETIDQAAILAFYARFAERTNPEKLCEVPPEPSAQPSASGSVVPSTSPSAGPSAAPSLSSAPSAAPAASPS